MKKKCKIRILKEDASASFSETDCNFTSKSIPSISNGSMEETLASVTEPPTQNCFVSENNELYGQSWYYMKPDSDSQSDHQWEKEDLDLAYNIIESEKKDELLYGDYVDMDPCFPRSNKGPDLELPSYIEPLDKVCIRSRLLEMHTKVENAKEIARNYRDKCNELKKDVMQMKVQNDQLHVQALEEKQKIRHFWRNEILEGQSRSGTILRNALNIKV